MYVSMAIPRVYVGVEVFSDVLMPPISTPQLFCHCSTIAVGLLYLRNLAAAACDPNQCTMHAAHVNRSSSIRFIPQTTDQIVELRLDLQTRKIQKVKEKD